MKLKWRRSGNSLTQSVVNIQNYLGNKANGLKLNGNINVWKIIKFSLILFVGNPVCTAVKKMTVLPTYVCIKNQKCKLSM